MPTPGVTVIEVGLARLLPVRVTTTLVPAAPVAGVMAVSEGVSGRTVNVGIGRTEPPSVAMLMSCGPTGAPGSMVKVAVIRVAELTTQPIVMPEPVGELRIALVKLAPPKSTGTMVQTTPVTVFMPVTVGCGKIITVESVAGAEIELARSTLAMLTTAGKDKA